MRRTRDAEMPMPCSTPASSEWLQWLAHSGLVGGCCDHDPHPLVISIDPWATRSRPVLEARQSLGLKAPPPRAHLVPVHPDDWGDAAVGNTVGGHNTMRQRRSIR
jgi:hypothetical protein